MGTIPAAAALRLAHIDPIGGAVAGASIGLIHQSFQQYGPHAIGSFPICRQSVSGQNQDMTGQVRHLVNNKQARVGYGGC
jgi:hypothetical protein